MNIYQIKNKMETIGKESHFFDHETLSFFGERLSEMNVLKNKVIITDILGKDHICYIISATRRKNAFGKCKPYKYYHYIDSTTFEHVIQ